MSLFRCSPHGEHWTTSGSIPPWAAASKAQPRGHGQIPEGSWSPGAQPAWEGKLQTGMLSWGRACLEPCHESRRWRQELGWTWGPRQEPHTGHTLRVMAGLSLSSCRKGTAASTPCHKTHLQLFRWRAVISCHYHCYYSLLTSTNAPTQLCCRMLLTVAVQASQKSWYKTSSFLTYWEFPKVFKWHFPLVTEKTTSNEAFQSIAIGRKAKELWRQD